MSTLLPSRVVAFINGVRFWPRSVSYSAQAGGHASFSLDVPAVPEWDLLPARSHCAVFFLDQVQNTWRLLCEGEYKGPSWSKSATGVRARMLQFRDIHGMWETLTYASIGTFVSEMDTASIKTMCNGQEVQVAGATAAGQHKLLALNQIIDAVSQKSTRISSMFKDLLEYVASQTPVESFYATSRKVGDKAFAFMDEEIGSIVDFLRIKDMIFNGVNNSQLDSNATLEQILISYENLAMYQHVPIPAPPIYGKVDQRIPEMFFMPQIYTVIPPACNVIFEAQNTSDSGSRNLLSEPTRAVVQLTGAFDVKPKYTYFMANSTQVAVNVVTTMQESISDPVLAMSHHKLSEQELRSGVVARHVPLGIEKVQGVNNPNKSVATPTMEKLLAQSARHYYEVSRAAYRHTSLRCTFLPYLLPGFPTLIEDASGPKYGIIESLTHTLDCSGSATTSVEVGFVRDLYVVQGTNRGSPIPSWLNHLFWPRNISKFYKDAFGDNAYNFGKGYHAAMVAASDISSVARNTQVESDMDAPSQCNMDELAALVVPTPVYTKDYVRADMDPELTMSRQLAASPDPVGARLLYQFRPGVTLEQFAEFHNLPAVTMLPSEGQAGPQPPADLSPNTTNDGDGHPLFGHAYGLVFKGPGNGSPYGSYDLVATTTGAKISPQPQKVARAIQAAIDRGITRV